MKALVLLGLLAIPVSLPALAQTECPQGVSPGDPRCGPGGGNGIWTAPPEHTPEARWRKTWGAIANDSSVGIVGMATGQRSRRAATRSAISHCRSKGGRDCEVALYYENQCAAIGVRAEDTGEPMMVSFQAGLTVEEASARALQECTQTNGGQACRIFYSDCTGPVVVVE